MKTSTLRAIPALLILALAACESPADAARRTDDAKREADGKVDAVVQATHAQEAAIGRKAAEDTAQVAAEGAVKIDTAETAADTKARIASQALITSRLQVRDAANKKLEAFDIQGIELRTQLEKKIQREEAAKFVLDLRTKSDAVRKSVADLDTTTADTFAFAKAAIDTRMDDLDRSTAAARARLN